MRAFDRLAHLCPPADLRRVSIAGARIRQRKRARGESEEEPLSLSKTAGMSRGTKNGARERRSMGDGANNGLEMNLRA